VFFWMDNYQYPYNRKRASVLAFTYEARKGGKRMERIIKRGDMYYADLTYGVGSEQNGCRPILDLFAN